jgi:ArsR family transcriptional regulator
VIVNMTPENATTADVEAAAEPCCAAPGQVDEDAILADVRLLAAAGNDTRYELLRRIAGAAEEVCVCELEPAFGVSQSAVSQALSRLAEAGLVTRRKEGSWRYYDTTPTADALLATLDERREEVGADV